MTALKRETNKQVDSQLITDDLEIIGIFKAFAQKKERLWIWQQKEKGAQRRIVHYAIVRKVDALKKSVELSPNNSAGFRFHPGLPVYLYSQRRSIALKLKMREFEKQYIMIDLPQKLNLVKGDFLNNIELVERENENAHKHKREAPRVLAKDDQLVGLRRLLAEDRPSVLEVYPLYDISQGGMSFAVNDPAEFNVEDFIQAESIDNKPLPKKLKGKVVSIKHFQQDYGEFKVGVSFKVEDV